MRRCIGPTQLSGLPIQPPEIEKRFSLWGRYEHSVERADIIERLVAKKKATR